jgi:hypothetical protein
LLFRAADRIRGTLNPSRNNNMAESKPLSSDREQQRADNVASRRQSGLEPLPRDREPDTAAEDPDRNDTNVPEDTGRDES